MDNQIMTFENEQFGKVRTIEEDGRILFCASDVAKALGYARPNDAISSHCRAAVKRSTPISGKMQDINFIPEGDVYRLITHSRLPGAEKFESWVFDEVLPSIRKNGTYSIDRKPDSYMIEDPIQRAQRWIEEETERQQLRDKIEADKPLVEFADHVSSSSTLIDVGTLAKLARDENIKIGRTRLFDWLRDSGYLISTGSAKNQPYQRFIEQGLFRVRECTYKTPYGTGIATKTMVTGKGQMYFIEKLRQLNASGANKYIDNK